MRRITAWLSAQDRRFWTQAALLAAVAALLAFIAANVAANLERQPFHFGLDFLNRPAGFSILQTLIPFNESSTFGRAFIVGLLNTLLVAVIGIAAATVLGFAIGLARLAPSRVLRWLAAGYVELFRNLPLLLILFFWYFGILRQLPPAKQSLVLAGAYLNNRGLFLPSPVLEGHTLGLIFLAMAAFAAAGFLKGRERTIGLAAGVLACVLALSIAGVSWPKPQGLSFSGGVRLIPEFVALVLALAIYTAAYIAEIVRAGIESVPRGQLEAADALGFTSWQSARLVVIPQAMRLIIPPLTSQYLNLTKNSSLAVAIAYPDLVSVFAGTTLGQKGHAVEILAITMGVYLSLSLLTAAFLNWRNARGWT